MLLSKKKLLWLFWATLIKIGASLLEHLVTLVVSHTVHHYYITFFKQAIPSLFSVYFRPFKQTSQFLQEIFVKKCPSSIWGWDLIPRPSGLSLLP